MLRLSAIICALALALTALGKKSWTDPYKDYDETRFMELDLEGNLNTPVVGSDEHGAVSRHMKKIGTDLARKGYTVDMMRDDEVVLVTIPSDDLFLPNDTLLSPDAPARLMPIVKLLAVPDNFKLVYAVHTDNTGSETYNMSLAHKRNGTVYDWLLDNISDEVIIIPYEMGDTDPIEPNDTRMGRAANRRLEIFLVPGPKMITDAHKGTLR